METKKQGKVTIIVGGCYGSESKGLIVSHLARTGEYSYAVRTGSIQAGHTVFHNGKKGVGRTIPVAWVHPDVKLIIGAGAYINPRVLADEIRMIAGITGVTVGEVRSRLFIDKRAGIHTEDHHRIEQESGIHERMGSTGEGCAEAIKDKMGRGSPMSLFSNTEHAVGYQIVDTVKMLNVAYDNGEKILLEGTQGTLLDLHLGSYPFVTSRQTTASAWATESGLSPSLEYEVIMVCRTCPIRVAGNSGPMPDEIDWPTLTRELNVKRDVHGLEPLVSEEHLKDFERMERIVADEWSMPRVPFTQYTPEMRQQYSSELVRVHREVLSRLPQETVHDIMKFFEITTVTEKLRRIARLNMDELKYSVMLNRPDCLALNFLNYEFPTVGGSKTRAELMDVPEHDKIVKYIAGIEDSTGVPVRYVNAEPSCIIEL